jgi:hypothetical protein
LNKQASKSLAIGDIQVDRDKDGNVLAEWVVISIYPRGLSRVKRNSLAHQVHAEGTPEIAKSLQIKEVVRG